MIIIVTGASGLIGSHLQNFLTSQGHTVIPLGLHGLDKEKLDKFLDKNKPDAIVHLAGENVAQRWTKEKMAEIKNSRINGTKLLSQAMAKSNNRPKVWISASAIGYYGNREGENLTENSNKGSGFLADVCDQWEQATKEAKEAGIRVVNLRIGVVLSKEGGALAKMLLPFQLGAGGKIGNGRQYMSWIDIDDVVGAIYHAITTESLSGAVNATAPQPVQNNEFTKTFGQVLNRPALIPVPSFALRLLFNGMADEMLISGQKVLPTKLENAGYKFKYPELEQSLRHILKQ